MPKKSTTLDSLIRTLLSNCIIDENTKCLLYQGKLDRDGYGERVQFAYRKIRPHRAIAHFYLGLDIDDENQKALHKLECPNKNCINFEHLYVGTAQDNALDRERKHFKTHCIKGHPLSGENLYEYKGKRFCKTCRSEYKALLRA